MNDKEIKKMIIKAVQEGDIYNLSCEPVIDLFECYDELDITVRVPVGWLEQKRREIQEELKEVEKWVI